LIRRDLAYIDTISGSRLRRELAMLFMEPSAPDGSLLAHGLGILAAIHPQLRLTPDVAWRWREALDGRGRAPVDELGFCVLADPRSGDEVASLSARLHLAGRLETALQDLVRLRAAAGELAAAGDDPMRVVDLLEHRSPAAVWALSVLEAGAVADVVRRYLEEWRRVRPHLRGDDLISLGVSQGVLVGELLRLLRWARLEGKAQTREDEVAIVREELARRRGN
jgi:tRNA nucleotidyltransferase (CCA-adding enzyme)